MLIDIGYESVGGICVCEFIAKLWYTKISITGIQNGRPCGKLLLITIQ
jgi:hypothetical protein